MKLPTDEQFKKAFESSIAVFTDFCIENEITTEKAYEYFERIESNETIQNEPPHK